MTNSSEHSGSGAEPLVRGSGIAEGARGTARSTGSGERTSGQGLPEPAALAREETLEQELAETQAKRDEYLADLQRLAAEYENYRKRAVRDQERLVAHAHERLVRELLPVLDDLERTIDAAERHEEAALVDGVRLVERSLRTILVREGLVEIGADGKFDPHVHEALLTKPEEGVEPGVVLEVVQRGYRLGDKVIRPARVIVAE